MRATPRLCGSRSAGSSTGSSIPTTGGWSRTTRSASATCRSPPTGTGGRDARAGARRGRPPPDRSDDQHEYAGHAGAARRAISAPYGVEYRRGTRLYRAHVAAERRTRRAGRGPRVARGRCSRGGAFNSPQLLMFSGIGPPDELQRARHRRCGWRCRASAQPAGSLRGQRRLADGFSRVGHLQRRHVPARRCRATGAGRRTATACTPPTAPCSRCSRARRGATLPDLFCMALVARFDGYEPGYSARLGTDRNYLTWVILKAHTKNAAGGVTLQSADPRDPPVVNFRQFHRRRRRRPHGGDRRRALRPRAQRAPPSRRHRADARSCQAAGSHERATSRTTCATARGGITPAERARSAPARPWRRARQPFPRPRHTSACASSTPRSFPRIPGFFIASAVYMIGEKAADAILASAPRLEAAVGDPHKH